MEEKLLKMHLFNKHSGFIFVISQMMVPVNKAICSLS